jgi:hypothetical protein
MRVRIQETWGPKTPLHKFYFRTRNWSQAGSLVPETRRSIFLSGDQRDLVGK